MYIETENQKIENQKTSCKKFIKCQLLESRKKNETFKTCCYKSAFQPSAENTLPYCIYIYIQYIAVCASL